MASGSIDAISRDRKQELLDVLDGADLYVPPLLDALLLLLYLVPRSHVLRDVIVNVFCSCENLTSWQLQNVAA